MLPLHSILQHAARADPRREAIVFQGASLRYGEVADRALRLASALAFLGVEPGERVVFWAPNAPQFVEFLFGTPVLGAIAVPLDHWWTVEEAWSALRQCRPAAVIAAPPQMEQLRTLHPQLEALGVRVWLALGDPPGPSWVPYEVQVERSPPYRSANLPSPDDPALILFTSGSTGRSKGAVHTHRGLAHTAAIMALEIGLREGERTLHLLPLFSSCLEQLIPLTLARATHVILPGFEAGAVWEAMEWAEITHFDAVPTVLRRLLRAAPPTLPAGLGLISFASEPMPVSLTEAWLDRAPQVDLVQFYGMIEQLCLTVQKPWEQRSKIGTVGRPMLGAELRILRPDGSPVGQGETGEISARGPTLAAGYWEDPQITAQVIQDGWMRTGDLGQWAGDGYLVLRGRLKEIIKSGGMTVLPHEVEEVLLRHPAVLEAAVAGAADDRWGEAVHAFVVARPGSALDRRDLRDFCRRHLAAYKCPKVVHLLAELPRTGIGKIARRQLPVLADRRSTSGGRPAGSSSV